MDDIKARIIEVMRENSGKGKTRIYLKDLAKKAGMSQMTAKKGIRSLMEEGELNYWHSGSSTYVMLRCDFEKLEAEESLFAD